MSWHFTPTFQIFSHQVSSIENHKFKRIIMSSKTIQKEWFWKERHEPLFSFFFFLFLFLTFFPILSVRWQIFSSLGVGGKQMKLFNTVVWNMVEVRLIGNCNFMNDCWLAYLWFKPSLEPLTSYVKVYILAHCPWDHCVCSRGG